MLNQHLRQYALMLGTALCCVTTLVSLSGVFWGYCRESDESDFVTVVNSAEENNKLLSELEKGGAYSTLHTLKFAKAGTLRYSGQSCSCFKVAVDGKAPLTTDVIHVSQGECVEVRIFPHQPESTAIEISTVTFNFVAGGVSSDIAVKSICRFFGDIESVPGYVFCDLRPGVDAVPEVSGGIVVRRHARSLNVLSSPPEMLTNSLYFDAAQMSSKGPATLVASGILRKEWEVRLCAAKNAEWSDPAINGTTLEIGWKSDFKNPSLLSTRILASFRRADQKGHGL